MTKIKRNSNNYVKLDLVPISLMQFVMAVQGLHIELHRTHTADMVHIYLPDSSIYLAS